jgi:hypothetical protein
VRAHHRFMERGEAASAVRCAFWLAFELFSLGEMGLPRGRRTWALGHVEPEPPRDLRRVVGSWMHVGAA